MKVTDPSSLFEIQKNYVLEIIKSFTLSGGLYSLIIDDKTEAILYQVIKKEQLLRIVTSVDKLDAKRKQQTFLEAIYFIEPTLYTLKCIEADVTSRRYKKGWGMFLPLLQGDDRVYEFYNSVKFMNNPKIQNYFDFGDNIKFVPAGMVPVELRVFLVDKMTPNSLPIYFNENCMDLVMPQIRNVARSLVNLMVMTGEYPLIRFYEPQNDNKYKAQRLSELIADEFQRQLDDYSRSNQEYPPDLGGRPRALVLIADRTVDLYAPLLHEFTYQAMANDIVPSLEREGVYKYKAETEGGDYKEEVSKLDNEADEDWVNLRHLHIIESSELITDKINELIQKNPLMVDRNRAQNASDLMHIVAHLKGFDEERKQVTLHKKLIEECLDINGERKLAEFAADFEQTCCAEGVTFEGEKLKNLHGDLIVLLARQDLEINDKVRLVLIYGLYRGGLVELDFHKLAKFIGVRDTQMISLVSRCFNNLHKLGFPIVKSSLNDSKVKKTMFHTINNDGTYNTSRFGPGLKSILQFLVKYQLDETWFPYFRDKPLRDDVPPDAREPLPTQQTGSMRNNRIKASWAQNSRLVGNRGKHKQKVFLFVAGGITYSETRSIYELSNTLNRDFYIGSETIIKPRDFLIGLQSIDKAKELSDLNINLYKQLVDGQRDPPLHLFEPQQKPQVVMPASSTSSRSTSHSSNQQSVNQMAIDFNKFNVNSPPPNNGTPSHYQKRVSSFNLNPVVNEPAKPKKTSRLKKLFK